MTKEERYDAINYFKNKLENEVYGAKYNKLAIEALEQEFINKPCVSEKVCKHDKQMVLDKIRAEIEQIIGEHNLDDYDFCSGLICARKIIDKYKAESKPQESEET